MSVMNMEKLRGDDETDTALLRQMALEAERYIRSFSWCEHLHRGQFIDGYGGVFALFLFQADIEKLGQGTWLWVFVGDVPNAYLEANDAPAPYTAAKRYLDGLAEWIDAVRIGQSTHNLIPIESERDTQTLALLETKGKTIETEFLEFFSTEPIRFGAHG